MKSPCDKIEDLINEMKEYGGGFLPIMALATISELDKRALVEIIKHAADELSIR